MFVLWDGEVLKREAELRRRELGAEFRRARWSQALLRRGLARVAAGAAYRLWRLSEHLSKGDGGGRGLADPSHA